MTKQKLRQIVRLLTEAFEELPMGNPKYPGNKKIENAAAKILHAKGQLQKELNRLENKTPKPTGPMTDDSRMPFGKHQGRKMKDVPASYLDWLIDQDWLEEKYPDIKAYIENNRNQIDKELDEGFSKSDDVPF